MAERDLRTTADDLSDQVETLQQELERCKKREEKLIAALRELQKGREEEIKKRDEWRPY